MTGVLDRVLALVAGAVAPAITAGGPQRAALPGRRAGGDPAWRAGPYGGRADDGRVAAPARVRAARDPARRSRGPRTGCSGSTRWRRVPGGRLLPTRDELARAIVVYNQHHLPAGTWVEHRVGLRLPLPVEIDVDSGAWIVNADSVRTWAGSFDGAWLGRLTRAPDALEVPDPLVELPQAAAALLAAHPDAPSLGAELAARALRNPFADVFLVFAALRRLGAGAPEAALSLLETWSATRRLCWPPRAPAARCCAASARCSRVHRPPLDPARVARARALLDAALFAGAPGQRTGWRSASCPRRPRSSRAAGRWARRAPTAIRPAAITASCSAATSASGRSRRRRSSASTTAGPPTRGGCRPAPFVAADVALLPTDAQSSARLEIVVGIAANEGNLDAIRQRDLGVISSGIHQWSAHEPEELPSLLFHFKTLAADEWDLLFAAYGLDVEPDPDPAHAGQYVLQSVAANGTRTPMAYAAIRAFFGGAVGADGTVSFGTDWAARFRLAALASEAYRRCQILEAIGRFDRIKRQVGSIQVAGAPIPVEQLISSKQGVALVLDSHINKPGRVEAEPQDRRADAEPARRPPTPATARSPPCTTTSATSTTACTATRASTHGPSTSRTARSAGGDRRVPPAGQPPS